MKTYVVYVVLVDWRLAGIYRSPSAARRRAVELEAWPINYRQEPMACELADLPAEFALYGIRERAERRAADGYWGAIN